VKVHDQVMDVALAVSRTAASAPETPAPDDVDRPLAPNLAGV
jgi:hypothetical protein